MAIPFHALKLIAPHLKGDVLSLGYPDLEITVEDVEKLWGFRPSKTTDANEWHKKDKSFPETFDVFERLGVRLTIVDFTQDRGMERVVDLNHPHDLGKFDLVLDPGTLEHCFNVGQAFMNVANAVKVGGRILHLNPMTMLNHGFYNFNPTLLNDFYEQNGWVIEDISVLPNRPAKPEITSRFLMYQEYLLRTLARREGDAQMKIPVQTKYLKKMAARNEVRLPR